MKKKYLLTEEHRAQLKPWAEKWIANAMSTAPMTEYDRTICLAAVKRLYRAANLEPPPDRRIIFVPSPFVMRFASGFAAWIWYLRKNKKDATHAATDAATDAATYAATDAATRAATHAATYAAMDDATHDATCAATRDATRAATDAATDDATCDATDDATYDATYAATRAATHAATDDATRAATHAATRAATRDATRAATDDATHDATHAATCAATDDESNWYVLNGDLVRLAEELGVGKAGLQCAYNAYKFWQGGNQWSGWDAFLSFFRYVVKLDINYATYEAWETLSLHSGPRAVHADFCIISDRPEVLLVDDQNRPHCATGPFCRWRDGSELYSFHGTRVPARLIRHPEKITAKEILAEQNVEVRRITVELVGMERFIQETGAKCIHSCEDFCHPTNSLELFSVDLPNDPEGVLRSLRMTDPSTGRQYMLRVPPNINRADDAKAWTFGFDTAKKFRPVAET